VLLGPLQSSGHRPVCNEWTHREINFGTIVPERRQQSHGWTGRKDCAAPLCDHRRQRLALLIPHQRLAVENPRPGSTWWRLYEFGQEPGGKEWGACLGARLSDTQTFSFPTDSATALVEERASFAKGCPLAVARHPGANRWLPISRRAPGLLGTDLPTGLISGS
jgi:hypothetical protein